MTVSAQVLQVAVLRVSFSTDTSPATTGDGSFVLQDTVDLECEDWAIDPPPHGRSYFEDHLIAADNYWRTVTEGQVSIDLLNSQVFPAGEDESYQLPNEMLYYHPYLETYDETAKLFELSRDAISLADPDVDFSAFSTVILIHAGMGGDFAFALDPTPGNIPSAYLSASDFVDYGALETLDGDLTDLIILPESQNFLQYKETRSLFEDSEDPCFYQVGLNGTMALMLGFHLGLPPMYDTDSGTSLVGGFALMDQGSNNFHGIAPAYPNPYTRIKMGWVDATEAYIGEDVSIGVSDAPVRVSISENEYYLFENRQRDLIEPSSMTLWIDEPGYDTVSVELSTGGVVLNVDEQHAGLPGNGLYIWHIDESAWFEEDNPNGGDIQLVDFVEADGAQDMGHTTQLLFADYLETGWWFDPWFAGNEGWFHLNRSEEIVGDSLLNFSSTTFPPTHANSGVPSHLRIENISKNGSIMSFSVASDRMVEADSISSFIGFSSALDQLWAFNSDSSQILKCSYVNGELGIVDEPTLDPSVIFNSSTDGSFLFRHPWIVPKQASGTQFIHIETGSTHYNTSIDDPYELILAASPTSPITYFGTKDDAPALVKWFYGNPGNPSINESLIDLPSGRFQTSSGFQVFYGNSTESPIPVGVLPERNSASAFVSPAEAIDVISWSNTDNSLTVTSVPSGTESFITVEKPLHIIPLDVDMDGVYEIGLFYQHKVKIINQAGAAWNGNPFAVETYFGNPIIGPLSDGEIGIFLRHSTSYSIHSLSGVLVEQGVLPEAGRDIKNILRRPQAASLVLTGDELLYFESDEFNSQAFFWTGPQGNFKGDRIVSPPGVTETEQPVIKKGSVFNYPNPLKGAKTTIRAWIGDAENWSIDIYSLNGAQVAYTEHPVLQKNAHNEWVWDAATVSNGVYLAHISVDGHSEIIKIAIIR